MSYTARYRFKLLSPFNIDGAEVEVNLPGLPVVKFKKSTKAYPTGHWIIAKIGGFQNESQARSVGEELGNALLVVGAVMKLGIDIGFGNPTGGFGEFARTLVRDRTGKEARSDNHGLMVYEEGSVIIGNLQAIGSVLISPVTFEQSLARWIKPASILSERQRNCAALINDSFFVNQVEGQFILRISAVEALCDQASRDTNYQKAVESLELHLAGQNVDNEIRTTLARVLSNAKRQSLRSAYMAKFSALRSKSEADRFDDLYKKRSKLVHDGLGRGTLDEATNIALELATNLLEADLQGAG